MTEPRVAGHAVVRKDIVEKVTGRARYTSDLALPGMVHAVLVRSPVPHGRIRTVDAGDALTVPGVHCVATSADFPDLDLYYGEWIRDQPLLAVDRVRFVGEPVAAVVADTEVAAAEAAARVHLDIEPMPLVPDAEAALRSDSPLVHPERESADPELPNVCYRQEFAYGDVEAALESAAYVHEASYRFPAVFHYTMEPFACLAAWGPDGLDLWTGTQQPFKVRGDMARMFGVPLSQVRLRVPYVGGGYGAKGQSKYEPVTVALARLVGRPVRLVTSVEEAIHTVSRHEARITMRTGVDADGRLIARDTTIVYDTGAYADKGPRVALKGAYRAAGPYGIPNTRSVALAVYSNRVPAGAFRGFSTPQVVWAGESAIDEIAAHLGEDPLEYRLRHLLARGEPFLGDDAPMDADLAQGLRAAANAVGWGTPLPPGRGRGVACGVKDGGGGAARSEAEVRLHPDGSAEVITASCEVGQGVRTVLAQIAADALGMAYDRVAVRLPDTTGAPFDRGTSASRTTISVGSAVWDAATRLRQQLCEAADLVLGTSEALRIEGHQVTAGDRSMPLIDLLAAARGLPPAEIGSLATVGVHDTSKGGGPLGHTSAFYEVSHAAAEVEVDQDTGEVRILKCVSVADVGFAMNPATLEGQDEGAVVMGLGHTLSEELEFVDGHLQNASLLEYRLPRTNDLPPELHTILLENRDGPGPFGAKGAGEGGILAIAPAVANAVAQATGLRLRDLPLTPQRVWHALQEREA